MKNLLLVIITMALCAVLVAKLETNYYMPKIKDAEDAQHAAEKKAQDAQIIASRLKAMADTAQQVADQSKEEAARANTILATERAAWAKKADDYDTRLKEIATQVAQAAPQAPILSPIRASATSPVQVPQSSTDRTQAVELPERTDLNRVNAQARLEAIAKQVEDIKNQENALKAKLENWYHSLHHSHTTDLPAQITDCESKIAGLNEEACNLKSDLGL